MKQKENESKVEKVNKIMEEYRQKFKIIKSDLQKEISNYQIALEHEKIKEIKEHLKENLYGKP